MKVLEEGAMISRHGSQTEVTVRKASRGCWRVYILK